MILILILIIVVIVIIAKRKTNPTENNTESHEEIKPLSFSVEQTPIQKKDEITEPITITNKTASQVAKSLGLEYTDITPIFEKQKTSDNKTRLKNALKSLPYPAAFNDAKIALRKIRKENNSENDTELKLIYRLAVWESFCIEPYSEIAECSTFNILEKAFKEVKTLAYSWNEIGYQKLKLNASDIKSMVSFWGEPSAHSSLNKKYNWLYKSYELKVK